MKLQAMKSWFARVGSVAVIGTICGAIGGMGGYAAISYAAGKNLGGASDYHIPYQGMLELGGDPVDGPLDFVFGLYTSDTAGATAIWTSKTHSLQVSRGYFATVLGDETDLTNRLSSAVMSQPVLYIGMKVDGVELAGRQRILAVPYAQNGMPDKNFVVEGQIQTKQLAVRENAVVGGNATVNQKLNVTGASTLSGGVTVSGPTTLGQATLGQTTINGTTTINGVTSINGSANLNNGANISSLRVNGEITTDGNGGANKLVQMRHYAQSGNTEFSTNTWDCIVAGIRYNGDIEEAGNGRIIDAYTSINNGKWFVHANFKTHNTGAPKEIAVACFHKNVSNRSGSWFN